RLAAAAETDAEPHVGEETGRGRIERRAEVDAGRVAGLAAAAVKNADGCDGQGGQRIDDHQRFAVLIVGSLRDREVIDAADAAVDDRLNDRRDVRSASLQEGEGKQWGVCHTRAVQRSTSAGKTGER